MDENKSTVAVMGWGADGIGGTDGVNVTSMREKIARAIIERWHPGAMDISLAVNGKIIVPPHTLREAQAAVDASLDVLMEPSEEMIATVLCLPKRKGMDRADVQASKQLIDLWQAMIRAAKNGA